VGRSRIVNLANFDQFTAINVLSDPGHVGGPVIIPNAVKFILVWTLGDGKSARNVLGGIKTSFTTPSQAIAEQARAAIVGHPNFGPYMAQIAPTASFAAVELQDISVGGSPIYRSTGASTPGTATGTELPNEVALVTTIRTAKVGAQWRGRYYLPGYSSAAIGAGNVITAAAMTAAQNFSVAISAGMGAIGLQWALLQPARAAYTGSSGTQHPARSAHAEPMTTVIVRDNHWDSQRRRGLK
jgi:hypothetical protein